MSRSSSKSLKESWDFSAWTLKAVQFSLLPFPSSLSAPRLLELVCCLGLKRGPVVEDSVLVFRGNGNDLFWEPAGCLCLHHSVCPGISSLPMVGILSICLMHHQQLQFYVAGVILYSLCLGSSRVGLIPNTCSVVLLPHGALEQLLSHRSPRTQGLGPTVRK